MSPDYTATDSKIHNLPDESTGAVEIRGVPSEDQ